MRKLMSGVLSVVLSTAMLVGSFNIPVFAEEIAPDTGIVMTSEEVQDETVQDETVSEEEATGSATEITEETTGEETYEEEAEDVADDGSEDAISEEGDIESEEAEDEDEALLEDALLLDETVLPEDEEFELEEDGDAISNDVQYFGEQVTAEIYCGDEKIEPSSTITLDSGKLYQDTYALDKSKKYTLKLIGKSGAKLDGLAVSIGASHSNKAINAAEYSYSIGNPQNGTLFYVKSTVYAHFVFDCGTQEEGSTFVVKTAKYGVNPAGEPYDKNGGYKDLTVTKTSTGMECFVPVADGTKVFFCINGGKDSCVVAGKYVSNPSGNVGSALRCASNAIGISSDDVGTITAGDYKFTIDTCMTTLIPKLYDADGTEVKGKKQGDTYTFEVDRGIAYTIKGTNSKGAQVALVDDCTYYYGDGDDGKFTIEDDGTVIVPAIDNKYAGKKLDIFVCSCGSKAAKQNCWVYLNVKKPITKVTVTGAAGKNKDEITQDVGTVKTYKYTKLSAEKSINDELVVTDVSGDITVEKVEGKDEVTITTGKVAPTKGATNPVAGTFSIKNTATGSVVASIKVITSSPKWTTAALTASLDSATPTSVTLKLKAPNGVNVNDNSYFYKIYLKENNKSKLGYDYTLKYTEDNVEYVPISETLTIVDAFNETPGTVGDGCGTSLDAYVSVVQIKDTGSDPDAEGNIFLETDAKKAKKLTVATKSPYHADKINIKRGTVNLNSGQAGVKVGDIDFGKNVTYTTTDYWKVVGVTDAKGDSVMFDAAHPEDVASTIKVYQRGLIEPINKADTGLMVDVGAEVPAGKYKISLETVPYSAAATLDITVLTTVYTLNLSLDSKVESSVFKTPKKALTVKTICDAKDNRWVKISKPSVFYEVGKLKDQAETDSEKYEIEKVDGLTVDASGKITISAGFNPDESVRYCVIAYAKDYVSADSILKDGVSVRKCGGQRCRDFYIKNGDNYKIDTLELFYGDPEKTSVDELTPITKDTSMPADKRLYARLKLGDQYRVHEDGEPIELVPVMGMFAGVFTSDVNTLKFTIDNLYTITVPNLFHTSASPCSITVNAYSVDGSSAKQAFKLTYSEDYIDDPYDNLKVYIKINSDKEDILRYDDDDTRDHTLDIKNPTASADDTSFDSEFEYLPTDTEYVLIVTNDTQEALKTITDVKLDVSGAKTVFDLQNKKVDIGIVPTKNNAVVKIMQGKKVLRTLTFVNDAFDNPAAPSGKSMTIAGDKLYRGFKYHAGDEIVVTLSAPLKDASGTIIDSDKVFVETDCGNNFNQDGAISTTTYSYDSVKKVAKITAVLAKDCYAVDEKNLEFKFNYRDTDAAGKYLTKTPTIVKITPSEFKKSFALSAAQTMTATYTEGSSSPPEYANLVPQYKATGIESVKYTELINYNSKGTFNAFSEDYIIVPEGTQIQPGDMVLYELGDNKNHTPSARDGYIKCHVTFKDGTERDYTNKVKITWKVVKKKAP